MQKIGIMGGTFNPIHFGHIKIARTAMCEYHLDRVIFLTSGNPPHKREIEILDANIRHIMVKRAIEGIDGFFACDYEVKKQTYSYTVKTLRHFKEIYPDDEIYFIIGGDSLRDFDKWYKPREILKLCTLLVYDRTGGEIESDFAKQIHGEKIEISSTEIRDMIKNGEDISGLVTKCVADFIGRNNLYRQIGDFETKLKLMLKEERFLHSLRVRDMAEKMAEIFGADKEKARLAGLLHDNAKNMDNPLERCRDLEVELDEYELKNPALIHAKLGEKTAMCEFGITDPEILSAIRNHTVGNSKMGLLDKIIFVADLAESGRNFPDVDKLRKLAFSDIDAAVAECVRGTIRVNQMRGAVIHPEAYRLLEILNRKQDEKL